MPSNILSSTSAVAAQKPTSFDLRIAALMLLVGLYDLVSGRRLFQR
ncbi:hypothetical protein [Granulicella arctica]|nr:hypothetical protein [Granulicella arctica]